MTHNGSTLDKWTVKLLTRKMKETFVVIMLDQVIKGLEMIHELGYSHGDLKPANICARHS